MGVLGLGGLGALGLGEIPRPFFRMYMIYYDIIMIHGLFSKPIRLDLKKMGWFLGQAKWKIPQSDSQNTMENHTPRSRRWIGTGQIHLVQDRNNLLGWEASSASL